MNISQLPKSIFEEEEERILSIPKVDYVGQADRFDEVEALIRLPDAPRITTLSVWQKAALLSVATAKAVVAPIGVGKGKTYIALLAGSVLGLEYATILTTAPAVDQMYREKYKLSKEYVLPNVEVLSIGVLQTERGEERLAKSLARGRDARRLLVIDEAHHLLNVKAARTSRVLRVLAALNKKVPVSVIPLSGTLMNAQMEKLYHIFAIALGVNSPIPLNRKVAERWGAVLDHGSDCEPVDCLQLLRVIRTNEPTFATTLPLEERHKLARRAIFGKHIAEAKGVVKTDEEVVVGTSIDVIEVNRLTSMNKNTLLTDLYTEIKETKVLPLSRFSDELDLDLGDPASVARTLSQVSLGFSYYYTGFGENKNSWLFARNQWKRAVRFELEQNAAENYDTEKLVERKLRQMIHSGRRPETTWQRELLESYVDWLEVKDLEEPEKVAIWFDDAPIRQIVKEAKRIQAEDAKNEWVRSNPSSVAARGSCSIWYRHKEVAAKLKELGVETYVSGQKVPPDAGLGKISAFSMRAHSVALNLQHLSNAIVVECVSSSETLQQFFGRFLRPGQRADTVKVRILTHTKSLKNKLNTCAEKAETSRQKNDLQYLLIATRYSEKW